MGTSSLWEWCLALLLWIQNFDNVIIGVTAHELSCENTATLLNGRLADTGQASYSIGTRFKFNCVSGYIVDKVQPRATSVDVKCVECEGKTTGIWTVELAPESKGCVPGCVRDEDCPNAPLFVQCNSTSNKCEMRKCPLIIDNAVVRPDIGYRIGDTAFFSCNPRYKIQHPDDFVHIARDGYKIPDENVRIQCQLLENGGDPQWLLLYRKSVPGNECTTLRHCHGRFPDVLSDSKVQVKCERGCSYDTHCPIEEECFFGQCIPKVCSPEFVGSDTILNEQVPHKPGNVTSAKCTVMFQYQFTNKQPLLADIQCHHPDPRASPYYVYKGTTKRVSCVKRCQTKADCHLPGTDLCKEGKCVPDCPAIMHADVIGAKSNPKYSLNPDAKDHHCDGVITTVKCHKGYVASVPNPDDEKTATVVGINDQIGTYWRHVNKTDEPFECIRGCSMNSECRENEFCDLEVRDCRPLRCTTLVNSTMKGDFADDVEDSIEINNEANFKCLAEHVYRPGRDTPVKDITVLCQSHSGNKEQSDERVANWIDVETGEVLQPCSPGCLGDGDCQPCYNCKEEQGYVCEADVCPGIPDNNADFRDGSGDAMCEETREITCKQNYVYMLNKGRCTKKAEAICTAEGPGTWVVERPGAKESVCQPGCITNDDCPDPTHMDCQKCVCTITKCPKETNDDFSTLILNKPTTKDEDTQIFTSVKKCDKGYGVYPGSSQSAPDVVLRCDYTTPATPVWVVNETNAPEPECEKVCKSHSECKKWFEACNSTTEKCQPISCPKIVPVKDISDFTSTGRNGLHSEGVLTCGANNIVRDSDGRCLKHLKLICVAQQDSRGVWEDRGNLSGTVTPKCQQGCASNAECTEAEFCDLKSCQCVARRCTKPPKDITLGGNIKKDTPDGNKVGDTAILMCEEGKIFKQHCDASKSIEVRCHLDNNQPVWGIAGKGNRITPLTKPCVTGCITNCDCHMGEKCISTHGWKCVPKTCKFTDAHADVITHSDLRVNSSVTIECRKGMVLQLKDGTVTRRAEAKCVEPDKDCSLNPDPEFVDQNGNPIPPCKAGCTKDAHCQNGDCCNTAKNKCERCEKCLTHEKETLENGKIEMREVAVITDGDVEQVLNTVPFMVCNDGYKTNKGLKEVELRCDKRVSRWKTKDGLPVPPCCQCIGQGECKNHCDSHCHTNGSLPGGKILFTEGHIIGSKAQLICDNGFKLLSNDPNKCYKETKVSCVQTSYAGPQWRVYLKEGKKYSFPVCERNFGCCDDDDCSATEECRKGECQHIQCDWLRANNGRLVIGQGQSLGDEAKFVCNLGYVYPGDIADKEITTFCKRGPENKAIWVDLYGQPVMDCVPGCRSRLDCEKGEICTSIGVCEKPVCSLSSDNGFINPVDTNVGAKVTFYCKKGYSIPGTEEESIPVTCTLRPGTDIPKFLDSEGKEPTCSPIQPPNVCQSSLEHNNAIVTVTGTNAAGRKEGIYTCLPGFVFLRDKKMVVVNSVNSVEENKMVAPFEDVFEYRNSTEVVCSNKGWVPVEKGQNKLPKCIKECRETSDCPHQVDKCTASVCGPQCPTKLDKSYGGTITNIKRWKNKITGEFVCSEDTETTRVVCSSRGEWKEETSKGQLPLKECPSKPRKCDRDCEGFCLDGVCIEKKCPLPGEVRRNNGELHLPLGIPNARDLGAEAKFHCKEKFVYFIGGKPFQSVIVKCVNEKGKNPQWVLKKTGGPIEDCELGCWTTKAHCKEDYLCDNTTCTEIACKRDILEQDFTVTYAPNMTYAELECKEVGYVLINAGTINENARSTIVKCEENGPKGSRWITEKGGILKVPYCIRDKTHCPCRANEKCVLGKCEPVCEGSVDYTGGTIPDNKYISGDYAKLQCQQQKTLVRFPIKKGKNTCYGGAMHIRCTKDSTSHTFWEQADNERTLPRCTQTCEDECDCTSYQVCDTDCDICKERNYTIGPDCPRGTVLTKYNKKCMPPCPSASDGHWVIEDRYSDETRARCKFHYNWDDNEQQIFEKIECNREVCKQDWFETDDKKPLSACVFEHRHCDESTIIVPNAHVNFLEGVENTSPHTATIECANNHILVLDGKKVRSETGLCMQDDVLHCKENKDRTDFRSWFHRKNIIQHCQNSRCIPGCFADKHCTNVQFCNTKKCECEFLTCPSGIENGRLVTPSKPNLRLFKTNKLVCNEGFVVAHSKAMLVWYETCREDERCINYKISNNVDIKCSNMSGEQVWTIDYPKFFKDVALDFVAEDVPARCIEGCETDEDCPKNYECREVSKDCRGGVDCHLKHCLPPRCPDIEQEFGYINKIQNMSVVGERAKFTCNKNYFMPTLGVREISVLCVEDGPTSGEPEWVQYETREPVPECQLKCRTTRDCPQHHVCATNNTCVLPYCTHKIKHGVITAIGERNGTNGTKAEVHCDRGYINIMNDYRNKTGRVTQFHKQAGVICLIEQDQPVWFYTGWLHLPARCKKGCMTNYDCNEDKFEECYETHSCGPKRCPPNPVTNGRFRQPVDYETVIFSETELMCSRGFIYFDKSNGVTKTADITCTADVGGPTHWVDSNNNKLTPDSCVKGCLTCKDCDRDVEICDDHEGKCEKIRCMLDDINEADLNGKVVVRETERRFLFLGEKAIFEVAKGFVLRKPGLTGSDAAKFKIAEVECQIDSGEGTCDPQTVIPIPKVRKGCIDVDLDCTPKQVCNKKKHECEDKICPPTITHGRLDDPENRDVDDANNVICNDQFFIKRSKSLLQNTSIECGFLEGSNDPVWLDTETGEEVACERECYVDKDCVIKGKGFCINHRCKRSICPVDEVDNICEVEGASYVEYQQEAAVCCPRGKVIRFKKDKLSNKFAVPPVKKVQITCRKHPVTGAIWKQTERKDKDPPKCEKGCVDDKDCLTAEMCDSSYNCVIRRCENPDAAFGNLTLNKQLNLACDLELPPVDYSIGHVKCKGTFRCSPGYVQDVGDGSVVESVPTECITVPGDQKGKWVEVKPNGDTQTIKDCRKGCVMDVNCTTMTNPCRYCDDEFVCKDMMCGGDLPSETFEWIVWPGVPTEHVTGKIACKNDLVMILPNGTATKETDIVCTRSAPSCSFSWRLPDGNDLPDKCEPGCVTDEDCKSSMLECRPEDDKCHLKQCFNDTAPSNCILTRPSLRGNRDRGSWSIGTTAKCACNGTLVFYPNSTDAVKQLGIKCAFDKELGTGQWMMTDKKGQTIKDQELPRCQIGCASDADCIIEPGTSCLKGTCQENCENPTNVKNGEVVNYKRGKTTTARLLCDHGFLKKLFRNTPEQKSVREVDLDCQDGGVNGARFCVAEDTKDCKLGCLPGCLDVTDCHEDGVRKTKVCSPNVRWCQHEKCCKPKVCSLKTDDENAMMDIDDETVSVGATGVLTCANKHHFPVKEPGLRPEVKRNVVCTYGDEDSDEGEWKNDDGTDIERCVQTNCYDDSYCDHDCVYCDQDAEYTCSPKMCTKIFPNGALSSRNEVPTCNATETASCTQGHVLLTSEGYKRSENVTCKLDGTGKGRWVDGNNLVNDECIEGCITNLDCPKVNFICEKNHCIQSPCPETAEDKHADLIVLAREHVIVCKPGYVMVNEDRTAARENASVRCCINPKNDMPVWSDKDGDCKSLPKCQKGCTKDSDCQASHEYCHKTEWTCKSRICPEPFTQDHGQHLNFPAGGIKPGGYGKFKCDHGYFMRHFYFNDDFNRQEVTIFCREKADEEPAFTLRNGAPIPPCERGCLTSSDCYGPDSKDLYSCHHGICEPSHCSVYSMHKFGNSFIDNVKNSFLAGQKAQLRCDVGFVIARKRRLPCGFGKCFEKPFIEFCSKTQKIYCDPLKKHWLTETGGGEPSMCVPGCKDNSDCRHADEVCTSCNCVKKTCRNTSPNNANGGYIIPFEGSSVESRGTFKCPKGLKEQEVPVVCVDLNPEPMWVPEDGSSFKPCEEIINTTTTPGPTCSGGDCPLHEVCINDRCERLRCSVLTIPNGLFRSDELAVGKMAKVHCNAGFIIRKGNRKTADVICNDLEGDAIWTELDGTDVPVCEQGCKTDADCPPISRCVSHRCQKSSCDPALIDHGHLVPERSSNLGSKATVTCDRGFLINAKKLLEVECRLVKEKPVWVPLDGSDAELTKCIEGCKDDSDCRTDMKCVDNVCQPKVCSVDLPREYHAIIRLEDVTVVKNHASNLEEAVFICEEGYSLRSMGKIKTKVVCLNDGTPKWYLLNGQPLPACIKKCSQRSDCPRYTECNPVFGGCISTWCTDESPDVHGELVFMPLDAPPGEQLRARHEESLQVLKGNLSTDSLGYFTCRSGYILDPKVLDGQRTNSITVKCTQVVNCGLVTWKLLNGADIPACVPGCIDETDCTAGFFCNKETAKCEETTCYPPQVKAGSIITPTKVSFLGDSGRLDCAKSHVYKTPEGSITKHVTIVCIKEKEHGEMGKFVDLNGHDLQECRPGCITSAECALGMDCINFQCDYVDICPTFLDDPKRNAYLVLKDGNAHLGSEATYACQKGSYLASKAEAILIHCTLAGWRTVEGNDLSPCLPACNKDRDCPDGHECNKKLGICSECKSNADCPKERPFCYNHHCQRCVDEGQCGAGYICNIITGRCEECRGVHQCPNGCKTDDDCAAIPGKRVCNEKTLRCVNCTEPAHCAGKACVDNICTVVECVTNEDCGPERPFCDLIKGECVSKKECRTKADCKKGEDCEEGICVPNIECTTSKECQDGERCVDGECKKICLHNADCSPKEECKYGECVPKDGCSKDADCPKGEICENKVCVEIVPCLQHTDCKQNERCIEKKCVSKPDDGCTDDDDCSPTEKCENKECVPIVKECRKDSDCKKGKVCEKGLCLPIGCTTSKNCPEGKRCVHGECKEKCSKDVDCPENEICDQGKKVCVKTPTCLHDADCKLKEKCVKNECVPIDKGCSKDKDCDGNEICDTEIGECVGCSRDVDCKLKEKCVKKKCVPKDESCSKDEDCDGNEICDTEIGECVGCSRDADCKLKEKCVKKKCVPIDKGCSKDKDCDGNEICDTKKGECIHPCTRNEECPDDQSCDDGKCVKKPPCTRDADCAYDEICIDNVCVEKPPECLKDADCEDGQKCRGGKCVPTGPPTGCSEDKDCHGNEVCDREKGECVNPCYKNTDCKKGEVCENGKCTSQCSRDIDCKEGEICFQRTCVNKTECLQDSDCPVDQSCDEGKCIEKPSCTHDKDCANGEICIDKVCVEKPECLKNVDCKNGEVCKKNKCVKDKCRSNSDCPHDQKCKNGKCSCLTNDNCLADEECENGICVPKTTTPKNICLDDTDCPDGKTCDKQKRECKEEECFTDKDCLNNEKCVANVCIIDPDEKCFSNAECDQGKVCKDGKCQPGCKDDKDCEGDEECENDVCVAKERTTPKGICSYDADCPKGQICDREKGECTEQIECIMDADCSDGKICKKNECVPEECKYNSDCLDNEECVDKVCKTKPDEKCFLNAECDRGKVCKDGKCQPGCKDDKDCEGDEECENDVCVDKERTTPKILCSDDADCNKGEVCEKGECKKPSEECIPSCPEGETCVKGKCVTICSKDVECPEGEICDIEIGQCVTTCYKNSDCNKGEVCEKGECKIPSEECTPSCPEGETCVKGKCVTICSYDVECPVGEKCVKGECTPPPCSHDKDCKEGEICFEGTCVTKKECLQDSDCKDDQTCDDGKCFEKPPCTHDEDCLEGKICIKEVCVEIPTCIMDADCKDREICKDRKCQKLKCKNNQDCYPGEKCINGKCQKPPCEKDTDCPEGEFCLNSICKPICLKDSDCKTGEICKDRTCQKVPCKKKNDCPSGLICLNGKCTEDPCEVLDEYCPNGICLNGKCLRPCEKDKDCREKEVCQNSVCEHICLMDSDCKEGEICKDRICQTVEPPCKRDIDCPPGEICKRGNCVENPKEPPCERDSDCPPGETCQNGVCKIEPSCVKDLDCPLGETCQNGVCKKEPPCERDSDCPPGETCQNGVCKKEPPCIRNIDCPHGEICQNGVCSKEPEPPCERDSDCPPGETCQNGVCKIEPSCVKDLDCPLGETCQNGVCKKEPPCKRNIDCPHGEICQNGVCKGPEPPCEFNIDCPKGEVCKTGKCIPGCNDDEDCMGDEVCEESVCVPPRKGRCTYKLSKSFEATIVIDGKTQKFKCNDGKYISINIPSYYKKMFVTDGRPHESKLDKRLDFVLPISTKKESEQEVVCVDGNWTFSGGPNDGLTITPCKQECGKGKKPCDEGYSCTSRGECYPDETCRLPSGEHHTTFFQYGDIVDCDTFIGTTGTKVSLCCDDTTLIAKKINGVMEAFAAGKIELGKSLVGNAKLIKKNTTIECIDGQWREVFTGAPMPKCVPISSLQCSNRDGKESLHNTFYKDGCRDCYCEFGRAECWKTERCRQLPIPYAAKGIPVSNVESGEDKPLTPIPNPGFPNGGDVKPSIPRPKV